MFDFGSVLDAAIARFTVGLVSIESGEPKPLGSGTLVKCITTQGILTCAHVLEEVAKRKEIGIVLFPVVIGRVQTFKIETQFIVPGSIKILREPKTRDGADLAFIPLPENFMAALSAFASVLNLDIQRARSSELLPADTFSIDAIAGIVAELTPPPARAKYSALILGVEGLINVGRVVERWDANGFDLIKLRPAPSSDFVLPNDYGATSGGGIWSVAMRKEHDGTFLVAQSRLIGVVFWQTEAPDRDLIGHGPESIYKRLLSEIYGRWPSQ